MTFYFLRKECFILLVSMMCSVDVVADNYIPNLVSSLPSYMLDSVSESEKKIMLIGESTHYDGSKSPVTMTNFGYGSIYYAFFSDLHVRAFDLDFDKYLGGWGINIHPDVEKKVVDKFGDQDIAYDSANVGPGCLLKHPLRYTDLDKDGQPELFILFGAGGPSSLAIFSTKMKKVIFSSLLEYDNGRMPDEVDEEIYHLSEAKNPDVPQYISSLGDRYNSFDVGYRSFGKLFFGDINDDGKQDIILWRKYFKSLTIGDIKKGFAKKDELFVHYALVNGEYKKQPTAANIIQRWLAAKQLSWPQGFPSRSECPGQEGQLIPALHDPLLNDPDVLH